MSLKTDYKNYVPTEDMGGLRRYTKIDNPDGTVSFQDVTTYEVEGSKYGADDANATNKAINTIMGSGVEVTYEEGTVKITAPEGMTMVTFIAPSNYSASDKYTINDDEITLSDLNGEPLDDAWKQGSPVTLTLNGNEAFFKAGGGAGKLPSDLAPLCPNFTVERNGTKVKISADKIQLNSYTNMVAGGVWAWGKTRPTKPTGENTKLWSRAELITTGKPYDGLYLGDVTPSDVVNETLIYLPENDGGSVKLVPFIVLGERYGGIVVSRKYALGKSAFHVGSKTAALYYNSTINALMESYGNSVLDKSVSSSVITGGWLELKDGTSKKLVSFDRKFICLSASEMGGGNSGVQMGESFLYFSGNNRNLYMEDGTSVPRITRTPNSDSAPSSIYAWSADLSNLTLYATDDENLGYTVTFVLPKYFKIQKRPDGSYTVYNDMGLMTLGDIEVGNVGSYKEDSGLSKFVVLDKGYNGQSVIPILRENLWASPMKYSNFSGIDINVYSRSLIYSHLVSYLENNLDKSLIPYLAETTVKSYKGTSSNFEEIKTKASGLSLFDIGLTLSGVQTSDKGLAYFSNGERRKLKTPDGIARPYWTRDISNPAPSNFTVYSYSETRDALSSLDARTHSFYSPFMFFVNPTTPIRALADGSYDLVPDDPALAQGVSTMASKARIALSDIPVSTASDKHTVKIPEVDGEKDYIVAKSNYEQSGGIMLVREKLWKQSKWAESIVGSFVNGTAFTALKDDFVPNVLDKRVQDILMEVNVKYTNPGNSATVTTYPTKSSIPSPYEMGKSADASVNAEGEPIEYFSVQSNRVATTEEGAPSVYRLRAMNKQETYSGFTVSAAGDISATLNITTSQYLRPFIVLPAETEFVDNGDGTYSLADTSVGRLEIEIDWPKSDPLIARQWVYNQKGVYQTMLLGGVASTEDAPAFKLPAFTGNHALFGDETQGRIELYESGTLTLYPGVYDFFLVGGGGSGTQRTDTSVAGATGGGGGGYTTTKAGVEITGVTDYTAVVGAGGVASAGSNTTVSSPDSSQSFSAAGGNFISSSSVSSYSDGASGGSGGGGAGNNNGGAGGSNGGNGSRGTNPGSGAYGGTGHGTTTRAFAEESGTLYAGGGGGGGDNAGGAGGAGGGGAGGNGVSTTRYGAAGTANTGGGGGGGGEYGHPSTQGNGGSGIIIVRWNNT